MSKAFVVAVIRTLTKKKNIITFLLEHREFAQEMQYYAQREEEVQKKKRCKEEEHEAFIRRNKGVPLNLNRDK